MHKPSDTQWQAAKWILRYVNGSLNAGLKFSASTLMALTIMVDSAQQVTLTIVDWPTARASSFAQSGGLDLTETIDYVAIERKVGVLHYCSHHNRFVVVLWSLLGAQHLPLTQSTPTILNDSHFALFMVSNSVVQSRMCHIEIDYHYIQEKWFANSIHSVYRSDGGFVYQIIVHHSILTPPMMPQPHQCQSKVLEEEHNNSITIKLCV